jgi:hypothetical protein
MSEPRLATLELNPDTFVALSDADARAVIAWLRQLAEAIERGERQGLFVCPARSR